MALTVFKAPAKPQGSTQDIESAGILLSHTWSKTFSAYLDELNPTEMRRSAPCREIRSKTTA